MLDPQRIRKDFPLYRHHPDIVYLDSTATTLKPKVATDAVRKYYEEYSANVFRGLYPLSQQATDAYEEARRVVADFIGASQPESVIFTRNTTESLNLIAYSLGPELITRGSRVVVSIAEHHANFVPWQQQALKTGAEFVVLPCNADGQVSLEGIEKQVTKKTRIVALFWASNVLGSVNDIAAITRVVKQKNPKALVIVDAAQSVSTIPAQVDKIGCDFLAFSGHKLFGPTGIGVLWGKREILERMKPFLYGGEMIETVSVQKTTFAPLPHRFEAGTPHIAGAIGLAAAISYLTTIGLNEAHTYTQHMVKYLLKQLLLNKHIRILGPLDYRKRVGLVSFVHDKIHPHDLGDILGQEGVCIRAGHHCAMPLHTKEGVPASSRASVSLYTTTGDIDKLISAINKAEHMLL